MPDNRELWYSHWNRTATALDFNAMTEKEKNLLAGCLKGDKAAWDALVLQYSSLVYHTIKKTFSLYHAEPLTEQVEDLYQEFFLSLLRDDSKKLRQFRGDRGCSLASWLRIVAARLAIDFLRKQTPTHVELRDGLNIDQPSPPDPAIAEEEEKFLLQAVRSLPPRDRLLLDLCFRHDLAPDEIAEILKTSVNAIYTQKSRVLQKLRETLGTRDL